ncbi:MAG: energy transducer TonB [Bacteroidota bacterium]
MWLLATPCVLAQEPVPADSTREIIDPVLAQVRLIGDLDSLIALGQYPDVEEDVTGVVFVVLDLDADGTIVDTEIMRSLGDPFDAEALRVARLARFEMPLDLPRARYSIPVRFDGVECRQDRPAVCR